MTVEKGTLRSGLTIKSLSVGTALVVFWALYYVIVTGFSKQAMGQLPSIIVSFFILAMITRFFPNIGLNPQELTVVYSMIAATMGIALWWTSPNLYSSLYHLTLSPYATMAPMLQPSFWCPTDTSLLTPAITGNALVPWAAWMIPMLWWFSFTLMMALYTHFFALIMRKYIIEIERLPFPIASAANILLEAPEKSDRSTDVKSVSSSSKLRIAMIGLVLGLIIPGFYGPFNHFSPVIPALPDELNLTPYLIESLPNALLGTSFFGGLTVAILFLWPTDLLLSSFIFYLIFGVIIPVVQNLLGILTYIPGQGWLMYYYFAVVPGLAALFGATPTGPEKAVQIATITHIGAPIGIAVFSLLLAKDHIIETIKAIRKPEIEEEPYRIYWIGLIASFLGFLALLVLCEMPWPFAILSLIVFQLTNYLNI